jgi:hypothetical protein
MQFVCEECANHQPDGSCLGAMIEEDLTIRRGTPRARCLVAEAKRCPYFEECVAPMADMASDPRRAAALQEAVAEYRQITNQKAPKARPCPDCGRPMQKGRQYCPRCAGARRKASNRTAQSRRRDPAVGMSAEVQKNGPSFPGKKGPISAVFQNAMEDGGPPPNVQTSADIRLVAGRAS